MPETWRMVVGFILVIVAFDLILGLPYVYGKQGLKGQTLSESTQFSDDVFIATWLEKSLYGCTSWQGSTELNSLQECTDGQTKTIYYLVAGVIPAVAIVLMFIILNPRTFVGLLREAA